MLEGRSRPADGVG